MASWWSRSVFCQNLSIKDSLRCLPRLNHQHWSKLPTNGWEVGCENTNKILEGGSPWPGASWFSASRWFSGDDLSGIDFLGNGMEFRYQVTKSWFLLSGLQPSLYECNVVVACMYVAKICIEGINLPTNKLPSEVRTLGHDLAQAVHCLSWLFSLILGGLNCAAGCAGVPQKTTANSGWNGGSRDVMVLARLVSKSPSHI